MQNPNPQSSVLEDQMQIDSLDLTSTANALITSMMSKMLTIQDNLNCSFIAADWKAQGSLHEKIDYIPTILDEATELMRSNTAWKFWKKTATADHSNMKVEFIDILHFAMSEALVRGNGIETVAAEMAYWYEVSYNVEEQEGENILPKPLVAPAYDFQKKKRALFSFLAKVFAFYAEQEHEMATVGIVDEDDLDPEEDFQTMDSLINDDGIGSGVDWAYFWQVSFNMGLSLEDIYATYIGKAALNHMRTTSGDKDGTYQKHWWNGEEDNFYLLSELNIASEKGRGAELSLENVGVWLRETYELFLSGGSVEDIKPIFN